MQSDKNKAGTVWDAVSDAAADSGKLQKKYNIIPKLLCVIAAFCMWLYVMQTESPEYESVISSVTVSIENSAELQSTSGLSVYSRSGNIVNVKLTGRKSAIDKLSAEDINAYIDVGKIKEAGQHALNVYVELPDGIDLVEPEPSNISVYVDETDTVSLAVNEKLENLVLTSPYELGEIKFEYDSITVTGPKNKLTQLVEAQVSVNMQDKTSSFVTKCPIVLVDRSGETVDMSYLTTSVSEMNVTVPIYITKEIPVTTLFKYGYLNSSLATVKVSPESITVRGDESKLVDGVQIIEPIEIDEKQITESTYTMTVMAKAVSDVIVAEDDSEINVTVELDPSLRTKQFTTSNIEVTGAPADLDYEVLDKSAVVTIRGTLDDIGEIKTSDISLVVDLSGYDPESTGTVSKAASVVIDSENAENVYELGSYSVQIKINQKNG